ncbi:restriction endonuclease subunit S [Pseudoalteromonas sp. 1181_04]|uniref:restriction endonuclease subunit S n=1 Tax=Pseudoalteromonas sp. 1181_04 TaxID=2604450 RepID=UPI004064B4CC
MSWPFVKLGDVAPSKPIKNPVIIDEKPVWQLNLDKVESQSGLVTEKVYGLAKSAGSSTHWFDERHVLYSKLRPYLNKVVLPDEQGLATTELVPLCPDGERLDRKYLTYYLRSNCFVNWISDQVAGAKMPRVSMNIFWSHEIPLPPLDEQKRIATILDKANAIRRKRQQAIKLADDFLRSVFLDMFGDPVTNPKGWEVRSLKDISKIQIGPFGTQLHKEDYIEGGIPLINPTHIVKGNIVPKTSLSVSDEKHGSLPEYHLKVGDIIMGRRGEMGRCAIVSEKEAGWMCGTGSLYIRPNKMGVFSEYLNKLLSSQAIKNHLESESQGATMPNLNKNIVGNIQIPVPSDEVLGDFTRLKVKFLKLTETSQNFANEMIFESLSQKAFAGEL